MKNLRIPIDEKNVEYIGGNETALEEFVRKIGGVKAFKGSIKVKSSIWSSIAKRIH